MRTSESVRSRVARARPGTVLFRDDFDGPASAVETAISRMVRSGDLARLRNGVYFKGLKSRFGTGKPPIDEVVYRLCRGRGVGPAGWSATRALGVSSQLPAHPEYAVVGAPPSGLGDVRFVSRKNLARIELRPLEIALLESLRSWPTFSEVDWDEFVRRIEELVNEGQIRLAPVLKAGAKDPSRNLRTHLGRLIEDVEGAHSR